MKTRLKKMPRPPCPKCGETDVVVSYANDATHQTWESQRRPCEYKGDHFHLHCRQCGYWWSMPPWLPDNEKESG